MRSLEPQVTRDLQLHPHLQSAVIRLQPN